MIYVFDGAENIVGKGENAGYQHFLLFPTMFSKGLVLRGVKSWDCVVKVKCEKLYLYLRQMKIFNFTKRLVQVRGTCRQQY